MDFERMLRYCSLLSRNNNRIWFHDKENYALYTAAKQDFTALVDELKYRIADLTTPDLAEKLIFADTKKMLYRIPRDVRGRRDKTPFNPRFGADISPDKHSILPLGYYLHIEPGQRSLFGTGAWCWESEMFFAVRSYISAHYERFLDILLDSGYEIEGEKLKKVPKGFDAADPAGEYLKFKSWLVSHPFADAELRDFDSFIDTVCEDVRRMEPLRIFFDDALKGMHRNPFDVSEW